MAPQPITWRNVNAPNMTGAAAMMGEAQKSFNTAFDVLQNTKDAYTKGQTDRNTQEFLNQLAKYQSPEALAQAQQSGDIARMRDQYSLLDSSKTNPDSIQNRVNALRQQATADYNYNQTLQDRAEKPLVGQFLSRLNGMQSGSDLTQNMDAFRRDLQARVDANDISPTTASDLLAKASQRQNTLTSQYHDQIQWNRSEKQYRQKELADKIVGDTYGNLAQSRDNYLNQVESGIKAAADRMGVPVKKLYDPEFRKSMTPAQRQILQETGQTLNSLDQPGAPGQALNQAVERMVAEGIPRDIAIARAKEADQNYASLTDMSATAQKKAQEAKTEYANAVKGNSWYQMENGDQTPADVLAEVSQALPKMKDSRWSINNSELNDFVNQAVGEGIQLRGEKVRLPVGIIKAVLAQTEPGKLMDDNPADVVENVLQQKGWANEYEKYIKARDRYKTKVNTIKARDMGRPSLDKLLQVFQPIPESTASTPKPKPDNTPPRPDLPRPNRQGM